MQQQPLGRPPGDVTLRRLRWLLEGSLYLAGLTILSIGWAFGCLWPTVSRCAAYILGYTGGQGEGRQGIGAAQKPRRALQGIRRADFAAFGAQKVRAKKDRQWMVLPRTGALS